MKAVGYFEPLPISHDNALVDLDIAPPAPGPRDLLVRVLAVSVNPVDAKLRASSAAAPGQPKVLGWDAVGVVEAAGPEARRFKPGDRVYYAGSIARSGTNAELHAVDERLAALAPRSLPDGQTAALPLTSITAWELLFDRLQVPRHGGQGQSLLVVGGAGGVGSILVQLARQLTGLTVIATASREETRQWCLDMGAHHVIDHARPLPAQLKEIGHGQVDMAAGLTQTDVHFDALVESLRPQGRLALIDDPKGLDIGKLKRKSLSLHWELMFTRSLFETQDMDQQGALLAEVAALVDAGRIRSTASADFGTINARNLKRAHALIESGQARGKIVLQGFRGL
ncbi:MAG: zinc-binding alcohol dehydrogenase family protein [Burkholderiales bacterium]|nr:zinc-binding alcohol dehydrogenase family protein [Burkholderiales bacterium]